MTDLSSSGPIGRWIGSKHPERRQVLWTQRPGVPDGPFRIRYQFYCTVNVHSPTAPMSELAQVINAAPRPWIA